MNSDNLPTDYVLIPQTPPPADYPFEPAQDEYSLQPFDPSYEARREAFLAFVRHNPAPPGPKAPWHELGRLAAGGAPHQGIFAAALDYIDARRDCADMAAHAILRLFYQFGDSQELAPSLLERARRVILGFRYWPDEPGDDHMCTWTESHYIMFASAAYLAGQLFPGGIFNASGRAGREMMTYNRSRILQWMNLRFFTGFSEWLSNVHYDDDLAALLNLVEFCEDEEICQRAAILIDLLLFDMALNNFMGVFGSTHGCSDENSEKWAAQESTTDTMKLLFGRGIFSGGDNMSAVAFALSPRYRLPRVLYEIANDQTRSEMLNRQRMGFCISQMNWWGLKPDDTEDFLHLLTMGAYLHPKTARRFLDMMDKYNWWESPFFQSMQQHQGFFKMLRATRLLPLAVRYYGKDLTRNMREDANIYTYRTPDYMLSSVQDYRKGYGGDQQHIWQASLGPNAVCFTTHPARPAGPPPNYWCGNGSLPRVAQYKNVLMVVYHARKQPTLLVPCELQYTHAWLPRNQFEQVQEKDGWVFAKCGNGYLALLSQYPYSWQERLGSDLGCELLCFRNEGIWLCELGRKETDGSFEQFIERILQAKVTFYGSARIFYHSPSQGQLTFGWNEPLRQDGRVIPTGDYPRYGNPYTQAPYPSENLTITFGNDTLHLNWLTNERTAKDFV